MNRDSMKFESVPVKRKLSNVEHKISNNQDASSKVSCGSVSSVESIASFANPNFGTGSDEELGFTSDSDFEEHPYSASKKIKLSEPGTSSNRSLGIGLSVSSRLNNCNLSLRDSKSYNTNDEFSCNVAFSSRHRPRPKRQSKCNSKNAVMARMNRLKKKKFIEDLEARNQQLEAESKILKQDLRSRLEVIGKLRRETLYLRSVIKNSPEIGKLLQCIHKNTNLKIGSSLLNSFKAEPDSTETSNHETTFPTRSPGQDSSKTAGAESQEALVAV